MLILSNIPATPVVILGLILIAVLIGLLFFRMRKAARQENRPAFSPRQLIIILVRIVGFALLMLVLLGGGLLLYVDIGTAREEIAPSHREVDLPPDLPFAFEEVTFSGDEGIQLVGWYVPPRNARTIILLHGLGGTRADMLWHAKTLANAGYGVLAYDERGSGESKGDHRSFGWEDGPDVGGAVKFIQSRSADPVGNIGIAGCSVGGQIALQGAILFPEIGAVWADGPANIVAADSPLADNFPQALILASNYLIDFLYERELGYAAPTPLIKRIDQIAPRPVMLVGGGKEAGLLGSEAPRVQRFAAYAGSNAQVWVIPEATHCDGPIQQPETYAQKMVAFFDMALK